MDRYLIVVAGGTGNRMGTDIPKQFLPLGREPVMMHSIRRFHEYDPGMRIIAVIHSTYLSTWDSLCQSLSFSIPHKVVAGGETRFQSVKNGLDQITGEGLVAVHDAARPLVSVSLIERCFRDAELYGNAIPAVPVHETVRKVEGEAVELIDRSGLRLIQTPQVFRVDVLKEAYQQKFRPQFTDDAALLETAGTALHLTPGEPYNIKITFPEDLRIAELLLQRKAESSR